jgi:N-acetylmuramoyl-L-alanine amidase
MRKKIVLFLITICCFVVSADAANKQFTLVIDAGHGGHDTGAVGAISKEKNLTLKFALAFGRMVERNCPDVKVIYTRKSDVFVELYKRAEVANRNKADLFISVHINALPKGRVARGFQTYTLGSSKRTGKNTGVTQNLEVAKRENSVIFLEKDYKQTYHGYDPNSPESNIMFEFIQDKNMENSVELAKYMQRYVCRATGRQDMGAQQDNLAVLRLSSMPGCLIELGFISTRDEEQYMNSKAAEEEYARGIFNAFLAYRKKHGGNITIPFQAEPEKKEISIPQIVPQNEVVEEPVKKESKKAPKQEVKEEPVKVEEPTDMLEGIDLSPVTNVPQPAPAPKETVQPVQPAQSVQKAQPVVEPQPVASAASAVPVFKVQIFASSVKLKANDARFKKHHDAVFYQENGMYKYTIGASEDYNAINRLRKELLADFPEAFVIAFKNGDRMNVVEAVREFKSQKKN